jgi:ATP-binding cassette subfamily B protein
MSENGSDSLSVKELMMSSLRPHSRQIATVAALSVLMIASTIVLPLLIGLAINEITLGRLTPALLTAGAIALLGLVFGVIIGARGIVAARLSLRIEHSLRSRLYAHLHTVDPAILSRRSTGEWVSLTTVDLIPISSFFGLNLSKLATAVFTLLGAGIVMFIINPLLALLALAPTPLTVLSVIRYRQTARPILTDLRQRIAELTSLVQENIAGAAAIRAAGREAEEMRRFERAGDAVLEQALASNRRLALFNPAVQTLPSIGSAIVVVVGGLLAIRGELSVVDFTVFYTYLLMLVPSLQTIGSVIGQAETALACARRVGEALSHDREAAEGGAAMPAGAPSIDLDHVSIQGFDGRTVVDGADLHVKPGGSIGIVGSTGSGKSVLLRLVNGLSRAADGVVSVGGVPVEEADLASLRRRIASTGADEFLFAGTIAENIAFARPEATREEIEASARAAEAHEFIAEMPNGYDTTIGDRGAGLSGGQRQRVALARALAAVPDALILDNATGSLDALTEAAVLRNLDAHHVDSPPTRVVVGYRPALLREVDEVLVLENGRIVERGTHDGLLASSERYRRLVGAR